MFRGFRVRTRILRLYESARNCAAVDRFGWNGFCHRLFLQLGLALQPLAKRWMNLSGIGLVNPCRRDISRLPLETRISLNFSS